jgi:flagellar biogenesis protein FliO
MNMVRLQLTVVCIAICFASGTPALGQISAEGPSHVDGPLFPDWGLHGEIGRAELQASASTDSVENIGEPRYESTRVDLSVAPVSFAAEQSATAVAPAETKSDPRRLAPRQEPNRDRSAAANGESSSDIFSRFGLPANSIYSTVAALVFVLGLFFLCMWTLRRGGKNKSTALPPAVVSVLGRVTLAPKHFAELLRIGNKLVLVSLTPDGPKPITEVSDPAEVDRLTGLCQQLDSKSSSQEFEKMFRELANDRTTGGFLGDEAQVVSVPPDLAAFRSSGGGRRG